MRGWVLAVWLLLVAGPAWAADERKKGADLCLSAKEDLILAMGGAEGKARLFKSTRIVRYATLDRDMTPFHFYPEPNLIQLLSDLAEVRFEKVPGDYDKLSDWSKETQLLIQRSDELPRERARIETYLKKARAKGYETHVLRPSRGCYIASVSRDNKILKTFSVIDRKGSEIGGALTGGRVTDAYAQCFMGSYLAHLGLVDVMKMSGESKFHRGEDGILDYTHAAWAVVAAFGDEKLYAGQDMAAAIDHVKTAGYQSCLKREERNLSCEADRAEILQLSHRFGVRGVRVNSSANRDAEEKLKEYALRGCETHSLGYSVKTFDKEPEIEFH